MKITYALIASCVFAVGIVVGSLITSKATSQEEQTAQSQQQIINAMQRHLEEEELEWRLKQIKTQYPLSEKETREIWDNLGKVYVDRFTDPTEVFEFFQSQREKTIPVLAEALKNEDAETRQKAIVMLYGLALSSGKEPDRYKVLADTMALLALRFVGDEDPLIRKYAVGTLTVTANESGGIFLREKVIPVMVQMLEDPDPIIREGAGNYLYWKGLSQYLPENLRREPIASH